MAITVNGPNGITINFPEGTDASTINRVMTEAITGKPSQPKDQPGVLAAGLEGAKQSLTFDYGDELEGGARALYAKVTGDQRPFGDIYNETVAIPRGRMEAAKEAHPAAYISGELAGGVAVPGGLAKLGVRGALSAAAGRGLGARTVAGAKEGLAYAAASGSGAAEGGIEDRLRGAAAAAPYGLAFGAAAPAVVDVASAVGSRLAAPIRGIMNPEGIAAEKMGEAIARDYSKGSPVTAQARFAEKFDNMAAANDQARVMDAGGDNVRGLMRSATNIPNFERESVRKMVDARQANQYARTTNDIQDVLQPTQKGLAASERENFYDIVQRQAERMDKIGSDIINPALKVETPMTPQLQRVLERPTMQDLQKLVSRKLADEDKPIGLMTRTEMLHRMKMELDDQIGMAVTAEKMGNKPQAGWDKGTLTILKRDLLNAVDNDTYKKGLKSYAGQAQLKRAAENGMDDFNKLSPEEIRATVRGFDSDAERIMYRMGAARAIIDKIRSGNAMRDRTEGVFSSPEMQLKLRAIVDNPKQFRELQKQLVIEAKMADSRKALQGNSTTARQLAEGEQAGKTAGTIMSVMNASTGALRPILDLAARGYGTFTGLTPGVAGNLLKLGASQDPRAIEEMVRRSIEQAQKVPASRALKAEQGTSALLSLID